MESMNWAQILLSAFTTSDVVGQGICVLLFVFSIVSWSTMTDKAFSVFSCSRSVEKFLERFDTVGSALGIGIYLRELSGPLKEICQEGIDELLSIFDISERNSEQFLRKGVLPRKLTDAELDKIRSKMNTCFNKKTIELNSGLAWLSVAVTCSPFCGLLGTVWGVMATFSNIASSGRIEINLIAPGISGALLTTVLGLIVAIPTVAVNTFVNARIDNVNLQMDIFIDNFISSLRLEQTDAEGSEER